jgi:hypothetical protein
MSDRDALQQLKPIIDQAKTIIDAALAAPPAQTPPATQPGPAAPPITQPPAAPTIPQDFHVDHDFGEGGGEYWPHDARITQANQVLTIAFTVRAGGNPNLDVFPGIGGWLAKHITDYFPFMTNGETRPLPNGTQMDGRGAEHAAGIPLACYTPGRYYYAVSVDVSQDWRIQFRQ